jgi:hypothetical protein
MRWTAQPELVLEEEYSASLSAAVDKRCLGGYSEICCSQQDMATQNTTTREASSEDWSSRVAASTGSREGEAKWMRE